MSQYFDKLTGKFVEFDEQKHTRGAGGEFAKKFGSSMLGKTSNVTVNDVVHLTVEGNPKTPGSDRAKRWALQKHGGTVGELIAAYAKAGYGKGRALKDIATDVKAGNIKIVPKGTGAADAASEPTHAAVIGVGHSINALHDKIDALSSSGATSDAAPPTATAAAVKHAQATQVAQQAAATHEKFKTQHAAVLSASTDPAVKDIMSSSEALSLIGKPTSHVGAVTDQLTNDTAKLKSAVDDAAAEALAKGDGETLAKILGPDGKSLVDPGRWARAPVFGEMGASTIVLSSDVPKGDMLKTLEKVHGQSGVKFVSKSNDAVSFYTGIGYDDLNDSLRRGKAYTAYADKVEKLDKLTNGSTFKNDTVVWRGIGYGAKDIDTKLPMNDAPPPSFFTDNGYSSTSFNPGISSGFAGTGKHSDQQTRHMTLFRIRVPKGTKGCMFGRKPNVEASLKDEAEVVMPRGTRYAVVDHEIKNDYYGGKVRIVHLVVVSQGAV